MGLPRAQDMRILDCGHYPSPHSTHTTGTARTADNQEICWDCADNEQRAELLTTDKFFAYLSIAKPETLGKDETFVWFKGKESPCRLTTWSGGTLANVRRLWKTRNNFAGWIWRFWAIDAHGQWWYGTSPGVGMYARMHKSHVETAKWKAKHAGGNA